jgi:hypothetical protein
MMEQARMLLYEATQEMQSYHDARSEAGQESERAQDLLSRLEQLEALIEALEGIE